MTSGKTVQISVRLTQDEADFIARFTAADAVTPSEKVRAIIRLARDRGERPSTYAGGLRLADDLTAPVTEEVRVAEHDEGIRSELVATVAQALPDMLAFYLSSRVRPGSRKPDLVALEAGMAERCFRLFAGLLRLGITKEAPCYDADIIQGRATPIIQLANAIDRSKDIREA